MASKGQITRSKANSFLNQLFYALKTNPTYGDANWIGLLTGDPGEDCVVTGLEPPAEYGYKRRHLTEIMSTPSNGQISNSDIIFFPESNGGSWGTITHFFICTSQTATTGIFSAPLTDPVQIPEGYVPIFRAGALIVGIDKDTLDT